ncbi:uncharacterized protein LOC134811735 [Bolinopsis microptera]|uniref:uncharacterized protein LOC134811735 n=1 Tax=Bolinopsis microptera TaxID=2820187 RepID=UPI00307A34A7
MILELLCLLVIGCGETRRLAVHPRDNNTKKPLEIQLNRTASHGRQKRSMNPDHGYDWGNKINITQSILDGDMHGTAYVEWGGTNKNSDVIIILTKDTSLVPSDSTLYISTDYGKTFNTKVITIGGKAAILNYIYQSPTNHQQFMLNDLTNKAVIVSKDEGVTWQVSTVDFTPSIIDHHPSIENLLLAHDTSQQKLYLSQDFGQTFTPLLTDLNIVDFYWGTSPDYDGEHTMFAVAQNEDRTQAIYTSEDFFKSPKTIIDVAANQFAVVDEFYFYVKKSTHLNHGDNDMDLFISFDRGQPVKAKFPEFVAENPTTEFYIADAGEGQAFVAVSHRDNMTNLYVSEHKAGNMVLSLERILFTNKASYDTISWMDGIEPFADFQAVEGLPGVFLASQLDIGTVGHRRIHTVMTYNKGGTWQYVQPPKYDQNGYPTECFLPDCALHISLMFGVNYPNAKHTPLMSRANAPGIIIASGNLGSSHSTYNDVFMSNDGGVEWDQVLDGQYHFQILDHGGVIVAARKGEPTMSLTYSHNEGVTWSNKTISQQLVTIYGLITEPGEITSVINIYAIGPGGMEWIIFTIDFKDFLGPKCMSEDFTTWSIRDELKSTECVLGKDTKYERKKPTSHCYIGSDYVRFTEDKPCPCQASDFECDFLYYRENAGDPCVMMDGVQEDWFIPGDCDPGTFYNRSMGYIKIEGDMCTGGEEAIFSYKKTKCPDSNLTVIIAVSPAKAVKKGTAVTFTAVSDDFMEDVYFLWYISDNTSFSGIGTSGQTFTNTFLKSGVFVITLTANNGAGPVVAMETIQVDDPITSLQLQYEPVDPAIGEGMIFIVTTDDDSKGIDISRLNYHWSTGTDSYLPILLTTFNDPGRQSVTVTVSNSISSKNFTVNFVVNDLTVSNIQAIPVSHSSIQVLWDPPVLRPGLVSAYTLKYRGVNDDQWHRVSVGGYNVTQTNYQVNGLEDGAQYQFLVVTTSAGGASSEESRVQSATTLPLNSLNPATQVSAIPSGNKATITWTSPGGTVKNFVVQYWMSDRFNEMKISATGDPSVTTVSLKSLVPGAPYTVRVLTQYPNKVESYSEPVNFQVEGRDMEELKEVRGYSVNSTSVVIVWDRPAIPVDGYNVYNATSNTLVTTVTEDQVKIGGLQPYTAYSFQVQPYSKGNRGKKSDPLGITTDVGVPGAVKQLECFQKSGLAVLTWHKPDSPNGPISKYLIYYDDDDLSGLGIPSYVNSDQVSLTLPQLPKFKAYKFSVAVQGPKYISTQSYTACTVESMSGAPGPVTGLYVKERHIASLDIMWRPPIDTNSAIQYEVRYGKYDGEVRIGTEHVLTTDTTAITIGDNVSPSTLYGITVTGKNNKGLGTPSQPIFAVTLTPPIGSIEYEFKFRAADVDKVKFENFANGLKEEIVQVTKISRDRLSGVGITHSDASDTKVSVWISPRDTPDDSVQPSSEAVVAALDGKVKKMEFVVGVSKALSGGVDHVAAATGSHHDVAEIVIPGICGLLIVVLVAGLLYYRNRYQQLLRRYSFRSRYANDDNDDVNMIECADEQEGISSSDLGRGALAISSEDSVQRPRGIKNFFERFNYTQNDQNDPNELIDDDEEHLLPL